MKSRRVILNIEVETDAPLAVLRKAKKCSVFFEVEDRTYAMEGNDADRSDHEGTVLQVQANVVRAT